MASANTVQRFVEALKKRQAEHAKEVISSVLDRDKYVGMVARHAELDWVIALARAAFKGDESDE